MKIFLLLLSLAFSVFVTASEMDAADIHESYKSGLLPMPYGPFSVSLKVSEDHSVTELNITVNGIDYPVGNSDIAKLVNINASHFFVGHNIYRSKEKPYEKQDPAANDFLEVRLGSYSGVEKNHTWYGDYFILLIDLEESSVKLMEVVHRER